MTDLVANRELPTALDSIDFHQIFDEHAVYVWNSLRRLGVPDSERDDLTQEVFITAHSLLADFDRERPVRPWLFGIAYRMTLRYRRAFMRSREVASEGAERADSSPSALALIEQEQARALVMAAIERIELHRRAVFIMAELDECSAPEIATALSIPLNTAYSRLRLARADFRAAVSDLQNSRRVP